jgi:hypothetical protein
MHDDAPGVIAFLNARWRVDDEKESGCCEVQHPLS